VKQAVDVAETAVTAVTTAGTTAETAVEPAEVETAVEPAEVEQAETVAQAERVAIQAETLVQAEGAQATQVESAEAEEAQVAQVGQVELLDSARVGSEAQMVVIVTHVAQEMALLAATQTKMVAASGYTTNRRLPFRANLPQRTARGAPRP